VWSNLSSLIVSSESIDAQATSHPVFEGAIDHVMSRGNARRDIVDDSVDRQQFQDHLAAQVGTLAMPILIGISRHARFH
jgi:hypothetical protein